MIIKCPECGHDVSDQAKTCPSCGIDIAGKITRCPDCGEVIFKEQAECPVCHCSINGSSTGTVSAQPVVVAPTEPPVARPKEEPQKPVAPRRPRKRRAGVTALIIAFVLALIVVLLGLYFMKTQEQKNEQRAYENAITSSEPLVLQNFLDMYADAPRAHRDSIKTHLDALKRIDLDWRNALVNNTKIAFVQFKKRYPNSVHNVEADIKIDSLDWVAATTENTPEAYSKYLSEHDDGAYYDEAHANYERLEAQKVTPEDRLIVSQLFVTYFNALGHRDVTALTSTLAPVLTSFLHRSNATSDVVVQYMEKLYEDDITRIEFLTSDDWDIEKKELGENRYGYTVNFTVAERIERTDTERETSVSYKVTAQVSSEGRITELNMKRSVQ
jgi:hypothetical protein